MKALMKFNVQLMYPYLLYLCFWTVLYSCFLLPNQMVSGTFLAIFLALYISLPESLFMLERRIHWEGYLLTMPVSRKMVVQSKYGFMLLSAIAFCLLGIMMNGLLYGSKQIPVYLLLLETCWILAGFALPIYFKKQDTGKPLAVIFILMVISGILAGFLSLRELWISDSVLILCCNAVVTFFVVLISYRISLRIYYKKEF